MDMLRRDAAALCGSLILAMALSLPLGGQAEAQARIDPALQAAIQRGGTVTAIAMFDHPVTAVDKVRLLAAGATTVVPYTAWPWAGVIGPAAAIQAIAGLADVREMQFAPDIDFYLHESVPLIGADRAWAPKSAGGLGATGPGIGVAVVDSGINATHPDLAKRVVKNLKF